MKKNYFVVFSTLLLVLVGILTIFYVSLTVFKTSGQLSKFNNDIKFYNEQEVKTDEMTAELKESCAAIDELYNSENFVVRFYSNSHPSIQIVVLLAIFISIPICYYVLFYNLVETSKMLANKRDKSKHRK